MNNDRALEERLGHIFGDPSLLRQALTHTSYAAEHPDVEHNERYEFLGDAILQLLVTEYIFASYPDLAEGGLAKIRATSVSGAQLAAIARDMDLGAHLLLGRGEEATLGRDKDSILADTAEAVLAAVYLDGGLDAARTVVMRHWEELLREAASEPGRRDFKTRLQEHLAPQGARPRYRVTDEGLDHSKVFKATVEIAGDVVGRGVGPSKKLAEQAAAAEALEALSIEI